MLLFFHHYNLLASAPLTLVLAHVALPKSALLAAVLMNALVHCSHILRNVPLQGSAMLAAAPLSALATACGHPTYFYSFLQAERLECVDVLSCEEH